MPNYDEIIHQSQLNVTSLSQKLKELDELKADIKRLIELPVALDNKFNEILKLTEEYTNVVRSTVGGYIDGHDTIFANRIQEFDGRLRMFKEEIDRLVYFDIEGRFGELQKRFMEVARKELIIELDKFVSIREGLETINGDLGKQIVRLENIDLESHFDKLQRTLSDIFGILNSLNVSLAKVLQTLPDLFHSLGTLQSLIENNQRQLRHTIQDLKEDMLKCIQEQSKLIENKAETFDKGFNKLEYENKKRNRYLLLALSIQGILILLLLFKSFGMIR